MIEILRVGELMKTNNIKGKDLALAIGISAPAVSSIANGSSFPRPEVLLRIADFFKIDVKDLFISTKPNSKKIHLIIDDKLNVFESIDELLVYVEKLKK